VELVLEDTVLGYAVQTEPELGHADLEDVDRVDWVLEDVAPSDADLAFVVLECADSEHCVLGNVVLEYVGLAVLVLAILDFANAE